jgi:arsenate reductase
VEIWYNPSCSKSRHALAELERAGVDPTVRRYLDDPPTAQQLDSALEALGLQPWDVARTGEPLAAELGLADLPHDRQRWIAVLVANPALLQRPLLLAADGTGYLGRDDAGIAAAIAAEGRAG